SLGVGHGVVAQADTLPSRVTLVAGTSGGTILRTDAGTQWHRQQNLAGVQVRALAAAPDHRTFYAGTYNGVWRSRDGGAHWSNVSLGSTKLHLTFAVAVHPSDPAVVYAATADGLYQTMDGGAS